MSLSGPLCRPGHARTDAVKFAYMEFKDTQSVFRWNSVEKGHVVMHVHEPVASRQCVGPVSH